MIFIRSSSREKQYKHIGNWSSSDLHQGKNSTNTLEIDLHLIFIKGKTVQTHWKLIFIWSSSREKQYKHIGNWSSSDLHQGKNSTNTLEIDLYQIFIKGNILEVNLCLIFIIIWSSSNLGLDLVFINPPPPKLELFENLVLSKAIWCTIFHTVKHVIYCLCVLVLRDLFERTGQKSGGPCSQSEKWGPDSPPPF